MRITRDQKLAAQLDLTAQRSTCLRGQVAALIVRDRRVISEGYNGAPPGMPHCLDGGCTEIYIHHPSGSPSILLEGCARTIHAETNAITWAARQGIATEGAEMWCTYSPCLECAKLIISAGLVKLTYLKDYRLGRQDLLSDAGLEVVVYGSEK